MSSHNDTKTCVSDTQLPLCEHLATFALSYFSRYDSFLPLNHLRESCLLKRLYPFELCVHLGRSLT